MLFWNVTGSLRLEDTPGRVNPNLPHHVEKVLSRFYHLQYTLVPCYIPAESLKIKHPLSHFSPHVMVNDHKCVIILFFFSFTQSCGYFAVYFSKSSLQPAKMIPSSLLHASYCKTHNSRKRQIMFKFFDVTEFVTLPFTCYWLLRVFQLTSYPLGNDTEVHDNKRHTDQHLPFIKLN